MTSGEDERTISIIIRWGMIDISTHSNSKTQFPLTIKNAGDVNSLSI